MGEIVHGNKEVQDSTWVKEFEKSVWESVGCFSQVYRTKDEVFIVTKDPTKRILMGLHREYPDNPHFPALSLVFDNGVFQIYRCPFYTSYDLFYETSVYRWIRGYLENIGNLPKIEIPPLLKQATYKLKRRKTENFGWDIKSDNIMRDDKGRLILLDILVLILDDEWTEEDFYEHFGISDFPDILSTVKETLEMQNEN